MFNVSFGEILIFGIIALIVLGPEKLPKALRTVLSKYREIKQLLNKIQHDLENELEWNELKKNMQDELIKIKNNEEQLKLQLDSMQKDLESLQTQTAISRRLPVYTLCKNEVSRKKAPFLSQKHASHVSSNRQAA